MGSRQTQHCPSHTIGVTEGSNENDQTNYTVGVYVATVYDHDRKWFVGMILERCEEKVDVLVKFMHPAQSQKLAWPSRPDICWVPLSHVLCCLSVPTLQGRSARQYAISTDQFQSIECLFQKFYQENI